MAQADVNKDRGLGDVDWHLFENEELFHRLQTGKAGLTTLEATRRIHEYGNNLYFLSYNN